MKFASVLLALVLACLVAPASAAPLAAYGKLPSIEFAVVSPSGHAVAVVVTNGEQRVIVIKEIATGAITLRGFVGERKVRDVQWAGDNHLVLVVSATLNNMEVINGRREWLFASTIDLTTKKVRPVMQNAAKADLSAIFGYPIVRTLRGEPSIFVQGVVFSGGDGVLSLFRIDLGTGANRLVEQGSQHTIDWAVDAEGRPVGQELYNSGSGDWSLRLRTKVGWREAVTATALIDPPSMMGLGRDGRSVLYSSRDDKDRPVWDEVRLDDAKAADPIGVSGDQRPIRDPQDGRLIGYSSLVGDEGRYTFFDANDAKVWKAVDAAFPGCIVSLESWSTDHKKIVVRVDSPSDGPAYAVVDLVTRRTTWLGSEYEQVKPEDVSPRKDVRFKARDGMELTGYLTLPRGRDPKALPLILFPHGGPASRDTPGFDWWAQGMASRGYAVLQINFRGSDGLGDALLEAGYGQWGRRMQTDLSDGVRDLVSQGIVDPRRVCIVGGSYGGYAALAGATLDPGVYRCAVSVAGVADLRRQLAYSRGRGGSEAGRYWIRFMGAEAGGDALARYSPAQQAAKADIPILLIHGKDDTVVPLEQSQIMAAALRKAGKPVELVVQKGEDHWLARGETRLDMLTAAMAFVEKHNPPN